MQDLATRHAFDEDVMRNPAPFDQYLLEHAPVLWDEHNKFFMVSAYELITEVVQDPKRFSSEYIEKFLPQRALPTEVEAIYAQGCPFTKALLVTDGDLHRRHRKIISQGLSRKRIDKMMPAIEARISALLEPLLPQGRMRFRSDFAEKIPIYITQEVLKIPDQDLEHALEWSHIVSSGFGGLGKTLERQKVDAAAIIEFQSYFRKKIEAAMRELEGRPADPENDDLCTLLASALLDPDDPMSMAEALSFLLILIPATHDTTTGSMTSCMRVFVDHPEVQHLLADDPSLTQRFIDEAMRLDSPNRAFWRRALCDTRLGDVDVPEGSWLLMRLSAANHDPAEYPDPYSFNINRKGAKPHLNFGTGIHVCVGRPIAHRVISAMLASLLAKGRNYRFVDGENDFEKERSLLFSGYEELVVSFDRI